VVTERIWHQEGKSKDKLPTTDGALVSQNMPMMCNHCGRLGHIRKYCHDLIKIQKERQKEKDEKKRSHKVALVSLHVKILEVKVLDWLQVSVLSQDEKVCLDCWLRNYLYVSCIWWKVFYSSLSSQLMWFWEMDILSQLLEEVKWI